VCVCVGGGGVKVPGLSLAAAAADGMCEAYVAVGDSCVCYILY
jgi:hypothetical protein